MVPHAASHLYHDALRTSGAGLQPPLLDDVHASGVEMKKKVASHFSNVRPKPRPKPAISLV